MAKIDFRASLKKETLLAVTFVMLFLMVIFKDLIKIGYVYLNGTEVSAQIVEVKNTLESTETGRVYQYQVQFLAKEAKLVSAYFKKSVDVYETSHFTKGSTVKIRYSNWTPTQIICVGY